MNTPEQLVVVFVLAGEEIEHLRVAAVVEHVALGRLNHIVHDRRGVGHVTAQVLGLKSPRPVDRRHFAVEPLHVVAADLAGRRRHRPARRQTRANRVARAKDHAARHGRLLHAETPTCIRLAPSSQYQSSFVPRATTA